MPRASSRSSSSACVSSSPARSRSGSSGCRRAASRSISASETSRCCAPSCRLRSSRRRSASPAATMRAREAASSSRALRVGQRLRGELGEVRDPLLGAGRERLGSTLETITAPHSRPSRKIGAATAQRKPSPRRCAASSPSSAVVVVDARRRAGPVDARRGGVAVHRAPCRRPARCGPSPSLQPPTTVAVTSGVEAHHVRALRAEQPRDLLGDDAEHAPRVGRRRDRGRHPPQRRLLVHQPPLLALARRASR